MPEPLPIYVIIGSEPDEPSKPLEIFMEPERAAEYVINGLMQAAFMSAQGILKPGDQLSVLVTLGKPADDAEPETMTTGSVAVVGQTTARRRVWDFRVEKRWAPRT